MLRLAPPSAWALSIRRMRLLFYLMADPDLASASSKRELRSFTLPDAAVSPSFVGALIGGPHGGQ